MKFIYSLGAVLGWIFLIYFCWNQSIPWWFKKGLGMMFQKGQETVQTIPKEDWMKPQEQEKTQSESDSKTTKTNEQKQESENVKSLFSGEIKVGKLRSRYNLDIQQNKESEALNKQDMGGK